MIFKVGTQLQTGRIGTCKGLYPLHLQYFLSLPGIYVMASLYWKSSAERLRVQVDLDVSSEAWGEVGRV